MAETVSSPCGRWITVREPSLSMVPAGETLSASEIAPARAEGGMFWLTARDRSGSTKMASSGRPAVSTSATPSTPSNSRRRKIASRCFSASEKPSAVIA